MVRLSCECKKKFISTSMGAQDCQGCEECGTSFGKINGEHNKLKPHDFVTKYYSMTGKPYKVCRMCFHIDMDSYSKAKIEG